MGVASSNTSEANTINTNRRFANQPQHNTSQQIEGFFTSTDPQTTNRNFLNSQFLEYGFAQPNLFLVPASNYSNVTRCNANTPNDVLNDSIFGTMRSVYGTTNTTVITPQNDSSFRQYRQQNYPNYDPTKEPPLPPNQSQQIHNTETKKQFASPLSRIFDFIKSADYVPQEIIDGQLNCERYDGSSNKDVEAYYRNNYHRSSESRCGFIYNPNYNGRPVFKGHYGYNSMDSNGTYLGGVAQKLYNPYLADHPDSKFYWEMDNTPATAAKPAEMGARNAFKQYACQLKVPTCSNVDAHNSECVWSVPLGRAVPAAGQAGYYNAPYFGSQGYGLYPVNYQNIITRSSNCPLPDAVATPQSNTVSLPSNCYGADGQVLSGAQIGRPCVQALLANANCTNGAIEEALRTGVIENKYGLSNRESFRKYTQGQPHPSIRDIFTNNLSPLDAQTAINTLGERARTVEETSINYAARDLCKASGTYDTFDFCTEYGPTKTGPFLLECVQRQFRVKGGQKTGLKYPETNTDANMVFFNNLGTWSAVNNYIDDLLLKTKSTDINTQAKAFNDFYGINAQQFTSKFIPSVPGVEVFWFTLISGTGGQLEPSVFLGRRIQKDLTLNTANLPNTSVQFISFFNLKTVNSNDTTVQYSFSNTDGLRILLNQNIAETNPTTGRFISAWTNSPTSRTNTNGTTCWPVRAAKPNYFTVSWYRSATTGSFNQTFFKTCDASPSNVNETGPTMVMSQEPDAPMLSFEVVANPTDTQINFFSSDQIPEYVFGDPRLWKIMPLVNLGSLTTIDTNDSDKFGFSNRYYGTGTQDLATNYSYLYGSCRFNSASCLKTKIPIKNQSWRTITMLFETKSLEAIDTGTTRFILQYGELNIGIKKDGIKYYLNVKFGTSTWQQLNGQELLPNSIYYMIIIQDFDTEGQSAVTTKLSVCCSTREIFTGDPQLPFNGDNNKRYTRESAPLWTGSDSAYILRIGGINNTGVAQTAGMDVGWVRFFDYVFTSTDLTNDMTNNWKRSWWNMI